MCQNVHSICTQQICNTQKRWGSAQELDATRFLQFHLRTQHWMDASSSIIIKLEELAPRLYKLSFIQQSGHSQHKVPCPVRDCCSTAKIAANLWQHSFNCHYTYRLHIEEDGSVWGLTRRVYLGMVKRKRVLVYLSIQYDGGTSSTNIV